MTAGLCILFGIPKKYLTSNSEFAGFSLWQKLASIDYFGAVSLVSTLSSQIFFNLCTTC